MVLKNLPLGAKKIKKKRKWVSIFAQIIIPWPSVQCTHRARLEKPIQSPEKIGRIRDRQIMERGPRVRDRRLVQACTMVRFRDGCTGSSGTHEMPIQQENHAMTVIQPPDATWNQCNLVLITYQSCAIRREGIDRITMKKIGNVLQLRDIVFLIAAVFNQ